MLIYDILIFAGAIALLVIVLQLRQFLASIYPTVTARVVDTTAPLSLADLYGSADDELIALPLVGGVTLGLNAEPSAVKRTWMSLMGPLPGIIVGSGFCSISSSPAASRRASTAG